MTPADRRPSDRPTPAHLPTAEESLQDQSDAPTPTAEPATRAEPRQDLVPQDRTLDTTDPAAEAVTAPDTDIRHSTPGSTGPKGAAGGMGVSSERVGHTGPGQVSTDGVNPTGATEHPPAGSAGVPPEQSVGGPEENPVGLDPKAGYPSKDPRSDEHPFHAAPDVKHS